MGFLSGILGSSGSTARAAGQQQVILSPAYQSPTFSSTQTGNITYSSGGTTYNPYQFQPYQGYTVILPQIEYEPLYPIAIKHVVTGRTLIIWEP